MKTTLKTNLKTFLNFLNTFATLAFAKQIKKFKNTHWGVFWVRKALVCTFLVLLFVYLDHHVHLTWLSNKGVDILLSHILDHLAFDVPTVEAAVESAVEN